MTDNSSLLAYLVPRLTNQVENAATDSLAYILNRSPESMQALNDLLQGGGFSIESVARVETQVTYEDGSRPDMVGYDAHHLKRLLVEVKFWHALTEDQASGYARQFDSSGPAVLMFIAPESRVPTLWAGIARQLEKQAVLEHITSDRGMERAKVVDGSLAEKGVELQVALVSWARLLDRLDAVGGDDDVRSDIRQLRGLAQAQDLQAFLPIHSEELGPNLGNRLVWYTQLVDDVIRRGVDQAWMDIKRLQAASQWYGYGRYFRFDGVEGYCWFGVNFEKWAYYGDTPLWLHRFDGNQSIGWIPIYPKLGVEYHEVLDDVVSKLRAEASVQ